MRNNTGVELYWRRYLDTLKPGDRDPASYEVWHFGDTEKLANDLAELVKTGQKTSTSALVWEEEAKDERPARLDDIVVVTKWDGSPSCIIEITEAEVRPFGTIDERFAYDYGEGDRSLTWWREDMWDYYSEVCRNIGREPSPDMPLECQRFRLLYK